MKNIFTLLLCLFSFSLFAVENEETQTKPYSYLSKITHTFDLNYQSNLKQNTAWKGFQQSNPTWYVEFDEASRLPHRAFGTPIPVSFNGDYASTAKSFLINDLEGFNVPMDELELNISSSTDKYHFIDFVQKHKGIEVFFSHATVRFNQNNDVVLFGLDVYNNIDLETNPSLSPAAASAKNDGTILDEIISTEVLKELIIVPVPNNQWRNYHYRLCYQVVTKTMGTNKMEGDWHSLIDAHSGELMYRVNEVKHCSSGCASDEDFCEAGFTHEEIIERGLPSAPNAGNLLTSGTLFEHHPYIAAKVLPLQYLKIAVGGTNYYSNAGGEVTLPNSGTATCPLEGRFCFIQDANAGRTTPQFTQAINASTTGISYDGRTGINATHLSAYYHINKIHDFMKTFFTTFTGLDYSLETNVEVAGSCNANWNGTAVNFFRAGGNCPSIAQISDVMYHEYAHAINSKRYGGNGGRMQNGALNEGYADVWACGLRDDGRLGIGFSTTNQFPLRRYDINPKIYPQNFVDEVHADGEIIAGAWWTTGTKIGTDTMMQVFTDIYDVQPPPDGATGSLTILGRVYRDVLIEALFADDNDGNPANGTPHGRQIVDGFAQHGILLFTDLILAHTPTTKGNVAKQTIVTADLFTTAGGQWQFYATTLTPHLNYRGKGAGVYNKIKMNNTTGITFEGFVPSTTTHSIIEYYISVEDSFGAIYATEPSGVQGTNANIPYYILIGYDQKQLDDMEQGVNSFGIWTVGLPSDGATTGQWDITFPISSHADGVPTSPEVQTGTAYSGSLCAVTANAATQTTPFGEQDIDDGPTTLRSPKINLSSYIDPVISYQRWFTNATGSNPDLDEWVVQVTDNGTLWVDVERLPVTDASWRRYAFRAKQYVALNSDFQIQFIPSDNVDGSIVEAAIDDIAILDLASTSVKGVNPDINSFYAYPNPVKDELIIEIETSKSLDGVRLEFVNAIGQSVKTETQSSVLSGSNQFRIRTADLSNGIYFLNIHTENGTSTRKISKID